jgi:hypothetical protein
VATNEVFGRQKTHLILKKSFDNVQNRGSFFKQRFFFGKDLGVGRMLDPRFIYI